MLREKQMREEQKEKEREELVKKDYGKGMGWVGREGSIVLPAAPQDPASLRNLIWLPSETLLPLSTLLQISFSNGVLVIN